MRTSQGNAPAYVVIIGRFMTNIGFFMVIPFLTIYITQDQGMSSFRAGLLFAILEFTRRGLGFLAGWASDRFGPARMLTLGLLIEVFAYLGFNGAGRSFALWALAVALLGVGGSLNNNGSRSLLAAVNSGETAINLSRYYVSINGAALIGPLIGTVLLASHHIAAGFIITAVLHLVFAAASAILLRAVPRPDPTATRPADIAIALRDRALMLYCALAVGGWFLITQYRIALPLTIEHQKLPDSLVGILTAANAVVVMIAVSIIGHRVERRSTLGRIHVLSASALVLGGGWLLCAAGGIPPIVAAVIVTSIGESLFCGVIDVVVAGMAPPGRVGLYLGYSTMAWGIGGMLGGLVGGGFDLTARHGAVLVFWIVLAGVGVASAIGTYFARDLFVETVRRRRVLAEAPLAEL